MLNYTNAELRHCSIHYVGNKLNEESIILSESPLNIEIYDLNKALTEYFLSPFANVEEFFEFWHEADLDLNPIYNYASQLFENNKSFHSISKNIAKHLFQTSRHPKIMGGELFIALLKKCILNNELVEVIAIFKSERKESFIEIESNSKHYHIELNEGVNLNKIDKGCLIMRLANGEYRIATVDNINKSNEAQYWKEDFLKVKPFNDQYLNTKNYLTVCKDFVTIQLPEEYDITKTDKIEYLNRSVDYFKQNEEFVEKDFLKKVFEDKNLISSFTTYKTDLIENEGIDLKNNFEISNSAVKKQARLFKSVLKLDKNFHIYIHGNTELIENGYDNKTGKKFYKIYYDEEM